MSLMSEYQKKHCKTCPERYKGLIGSCIANGRVDGLWLLSRIVDEVRCYCHDKPKILYISRCVYSAFIQVSQWPTRNIVKHSLAHWPLFCDIEIRVDDELPVLNARAVFDDHEKIFAGKLKNLLTNR